MLLLPTCYTVVSHRDEKLEAEWLEQARAKGDPRADPRLWDFKPHAVTQDDKKAIDSILRLRSDHAEFAPLKYKPCPEPNETYTEKTYHERNERNRMRAEGKKEEMDKLEETLKEAHLKKMKARAKSAAGSSSSGAAASAKLAKSEDGKKLWSVVGGGKSGGIMVRREKGLQSPELGRLATGTKIKQLELKGDRLHYEKVEGDGPDFGWVSLSNKGVDLLKRVEV
mmetsp:Transcript_77956/g.176191  ORF Transcript_77956/g.176191 Transcript_77956/m.176191 type:complete len:225 (+) Transcript_77956:3-677(+)